MPSEIIQLFVHLGEAGKDHRTLKQWSKESCFGQGFVVPLVE